MAIKKWKLEVVELAKMKPHPDNKKERKITPDARAGLTYSLKTFGDVQPIVWNERSGYIVGGHVRAEIHRAEGDVSAYALVVDLSEEHERALRVTLNAHPISGDFADGLQATLEKIETDSRELLEGLHLDELQTDPADEVKVFEVATGDVADTFVITILGPLPAQPDVLEQLRRALLAIPDCDVQIQIQKRGE